MSLRVTTSNVKPDIVVLHLVGEHDDRARDRHTRIALPRTAGPANHEAGVRSDWYRRDRLRRHLVYRPVFLRSAVCQKRTSICGRKTGVLRPFKNAMLDTLLPFDATVSAACEHFSSRAKSGGSPV